MQNAVRGDDTKGTGILANELYVGRYVWNRSQWLKNPDTGRRKYVLRPENEWIVNELPELRIIPPDLWEAARKRRRAQSERIGEAVRRGIARRKALPPGGKAKYLLSGLMTCGECGSKFIIMNRTSYGCAGHVNGKLCGNGLLVKRALAEELLLAGIRNDLLTPEIEAEVRRRFAQRIAHKKRPEKTRARRVELQKEITNLTDAIASGLLRTSPALAERLASAERALEELTPAADTPDLENAAELLPQLMERFRSLAGDLGRLAEHDVVRARTEVERLVGIVSLVPENGVLVAEINRAHVAGALLSATGARLQMDMVAGACFGNFRRSVFIA